MKVCKITFYQSVVIGKSGFLTVYEGQPETKGVEIEYLKEVGLIRISGKIKGSKLDTIAYVGLANVKCFHVKAEDDTIEVEDAEDQDESESNITKIETVNLSPEDEKIFITEALKRHGVNPHPMTGLKKLKEKLKELEG